MIDALVLACLLCAEPAAHPPPFLPAPVEIPAELMPLLGGNYVITSPQTPPHVVPMDGPVLAPQSINLRCLSPFCGPGRIIRLPDCRKGPC